MSRAGVCNGEGLMHHCVEERWCGSGPRASPPTGASHRLLVVWTNGSGLVSLGSRCPAGRSHIGCPRLVGVALSWRAHRRASRRGEAQEGSAQLEVALPSSSTTFGFKSMECSDGTCGRRVAAEPARCWDRTPSRGWKPRPPQRPPLLRAGLLADEMLADAAKVAVHTWRRRATFGRSNVFVAVPRQFHGVRFATADDRMIFASGRSRGLVYEWGKPATRVAVHGSECQRRVKTDPLAPCGFDGTLGSQFTRQGQRTCRV